MQNLFKSVVVVLFATVLLSACAINPRSSDWTSPKTLTEAQVFNAAVSAGGETGFSATSKDRETNNLTLTKTIGKHDMTLTVRVKNQGGKIHVAAIANYPDVVPSGIYGEIINNFHAALFRNLNIEQSEINNVVIQEVK